MVSLLLHVGLLLLAYISWEHAPKPISVSAVPVELVAKVPSRAQAEAPVDKLAVKAPQPIPAPEEQPKPTPPTPAPPLPVPAPQKEVVPQKKPEPKPVPVPKPPEPKAPPKAEPKPVPKPADKAPPDKDGLKKPTPTDKTKAAPAKPAPTPAKAAPAKPTLDLDALAQTAASPSKAPTRTQAQANTHRTTGISNTGAAAADAGVVDQALTALTSKLGHIWAPNCDVPGGNKVDLHLLFVISPNGRVISGPQWTNPRNDPVWEAAATRAKAAVKRGELYDDLPAGVYNKQLDIEFDAQKVCSGQE